MSGGKTLGFFEGNKELYLVQSAANSIVRSTTVPLIAGDEQEGVASSDIRLTAIIQKAVRTDHVAVNQIKLSVPTGESLVRSFTVPNMKQSEVDAGIEFEIKKHVPFNLEELLYSYHALPIVQDTVQKLLIVFTVVRRAYFERTTKILEQAGLQVIFCEPAPLSAVRALMAKKIISADQKIAVLQLEPLQARVLFLYEGVVVFMREFPLPEAGPAQEEPMQKSRFLNEVRNSLEFYNRQYSQPISQMVILSSLAQCPHEQWLREDLTIEVKPVKADSITGPGSSDQMGAINAFGVSLANDTKAKYTFDFLRNKAAKPSLMSFSFDLSEYANAIKTAIVCGVVLGGVFILTQVGLTGLKRSVEDLNIRQGAFTDQSTDDIKAKIDLNNTKLKNYKSISVKSKTTSIFVYISALLPEGIWLQTFTVNSSTDKEKQGLQWSMALQGYAYTSDPNQEISLVYDLVNKIKKDQHLAEYFKNVTLDSLQRQESSDNTVILFHLSCT